MGVGALSVQLETQVALLRDQLSEERQKREQSVSEYARGQNQFQEKLRTLEMELMSRIKEQRESQMQVVASFEEDKTRLIKNGG